MDKGRIAFMTWAHNAEKFIRKSAESVLSQTHKDLAYYLIDNESTDRTWQIIRELADEDSRVIAIQGENTYEALPGHIARIKDCEYFAVLDADDWYEPEFAEELIQFAQRQNLDIAVGGSKFYQVEGDEISIRKIKHNKIFEKKDILDNMESIFPHFRAIWGKIFRVDILRKMDFSDFNQLAATKTFLGVDQLFCLETLRHVNRVGMLDKILHTYLIYPQSVTNRFHPQRAFISVFLMQTLETFLTCDGKISEKNEVLLSQICWKDLCLTAKNIMEFDVEIKCKLSEFIKVAKCPVIQKYMNGFDDMKLFVVHLLVTAISQADIDEEVAQLFAECTQLLRVS